MQLTKEALKGKIVMLSGLRGTGKSFAAKAIAKQFNTVIYTANKDDIATYWSESNFVVINEPDFVNSFPFWCKQIRKWADERKINCVLIDDADVLFKTHFDTNPELRNLWANCRHMGLTIIMITHRLTDIPRRLYGQVDYMMLFTIEDISTVQTLNDVHEGLGDNVKGIPFGSYNFMFKGIGQQPVLSKI